MTQYVLAWTSGHVPPRTMYFQRLPIAWEPTEDRSAATRFESADAARDQWRRIHAFPEDCEAEWADGSVRAEAVGEPEFVLGGEEAESGKAKAESGKAKAERTR